MSENLHSTPAVSSNPVSLPVTDISDQMPACHEDAEVLDLDDLLEEPDHPEYCTQNGGDCSTCSLVNYGLDCQNNPIRNQEVRHD